LRGPGKERKQLKAKGEHGLGTIALELKP